MSTIALALVFFFYYQNNNLETTTYHLSNDRVGNVNIVHLSDLHGKQFGPRNQELYARVMERAPDVIVCTGDMIDYTARNFDNVIWFLGSLAEQVPVVYVSGNHEWRSERRDELLGCLSERGVFTLDNEIVTLATAGGMVNIVGFDTRYTHEDEVPESQLLDRLSLMPGLRIVLSHYPQRYALIGDQSYKYHEFDLMFSGHAHGGVWILPNIGGLYAHGQGIKPTYYRGLYDDRLLVSAGLGYRFVPLRLFNYPQIIEVRINE